MKKAISIFIGAVAIVIWSAATPRALHALPPDINPATMACFGTPWMSSGPDGCGPLQIGADNMTSIMMVMDGGETFSVWLEQDWQLFLEAQAQADFAQATFRGDVKARGFLSPSAPLLLADTELDHTHATVRVGAPITLWLPEAGYHVGRNFTIKPLPGAVATVETTNGEGIDGQLAQVVHPPDCMTVEAFYDHAASPPAGGWIIVGGCR